ncbi:Mo-dependent nitrogenase C-terminal domain-containing protein [Gloeocapsa sp. PCC 73106]|uniref:Mo-dependent nitrogenase C-terminal domain-containing protein n=1 Tax=Gloeocapsa sp. PCC 73106 TaxID=102232 RepID=UPI0002AC5BF7|nr:Mo-dependent nitrogenase C-terminal domain-containing protein [Gloeocapsa sp. PCC 73106]ELR98990.1 Mo-dependent nitrogenase [Gloeocapsa sp. PCC 73106]
MDMTDYTIKQIILWHWQYPTEEKKAEQTVTKTKKIDLLFPLRQWLDNYEISNAKAARNICALIPAQCPFARKVQLWGKTILTIPPLCKLNPLYEEVMILRFRALSYLVEECREDVSNYC